MKKNIIGLTLIIFGFTNSIYAMVADLKKNEEDLVKAKAEIVKTQGDLTKTYEDIQATIVAPLKKALDTITAQAKDLSNAISGIQSIPNEVLDLALIGDLRPTLQSITAPNGPIDLIGEKTLKPLYEGVQSSIEGLNPKTDPQGVYANLKNSSAAFDKAIQNMEDLQKALAKTAAIFEEQ